MAEERVERRLVAVLAADVVGYSRLMERDEAGTLAALRARRKGVLEPVLARHQGRLVRASGDGILTEFASAVSAVSCAVELQETMHAANAALPEDRQIIWRIGINLGDVLVEDGDLFGDGVNIAARLEALADPGSVFVSQTVFAHVRGKVEFGFEDLGEQVLKNMAERVRVYRVSAATAGSTASSDTVVVGISKPSIAVLPFVNMSGDPEQEYFSDGITEDIITDLSKVSGLSVLSSNSVFAFKGRAVDIGQMARQLKVGHVVEGSVRKAGGRVRITAQLIDASKNSHVWAERYDRDLQDIFALQDEISQAIVTALKVRLLPAEQKAIESRSTQDPRAYELYLLARYYQTQYGTKSQEIGLRFCRRALEIDPNYARAWALAAMCEALLYWWGRGKQSGLSAAEAALSLDPTLAAAHAAKGQALFHAGHTVEAIAAHEQSLELEPDSYDVRMSYGLTCMYMGRPEGAIGHFERGAQLLEADYLCLSMAAACYHGLGRHDDCKSAARRSLVRIEREIALRPDNANAMVMGAIGLTYLEEGERAKDWALRALTIDPEDELNRYNLACVFAQLKEIDQALELLESHARSMAPERINWIKRDADLEPLRHSPRYQELVAQYEGRLAATQATQATRN
jgi:adenylate cyclase